MRISPLLAVLAAGCAPVPAVLGPQPARIEFFRANPDCRAGSPICEARVNHAEGTPVMTLSSHADLEPGAHVLGLFCRMNDSPMIGDARTFQRELEIVLAPGGRYRVVAGMEPRPCTLKLIDEATGQPVGKMR